MSIKNKKGVELSLETVVVFIILVIVLIVILYFFIGHYTEGSTNLINSSSELIKESNNIN